LCLDWLPTYPRVCGIKPDVVRIVNFFVLALSPFCCFVVFGSMALLGLRLDFVIWVLGLVGPWIRICDSLICVFGLDWRFWA